ncbi:MAG: trehalose-6-phosphate synthase [Candidatus Hadarchaeia archaeon]
MSMETGRLVLVSNAEPYVHSKEGSEIVCERQAGGLTSALDPLLQNTGGIWIAWGRGGETDFAVLDKEGKVRVPDKGGFQLKRLKLTKKEVDNFYLGFSNRILWPLSHSMPEKSVMDDYDTAREYWNSYEEVNRKYTDAILEEITEGDNIWIHDYQLALVPKMVRENRPEANIGFFWHIPWPPWEIFGTLPWSEEILRGILGSDFIGFHTSRFEKNFLGCAEAMDMCIDEKCSAISADGTKSRVSHIPLGIEYHLYDSLSGNEEVKEKTRYLKKEINADKIIVSVDRLDYTKGIPERLRAFELFLKKNPEYLGKVTLVQRIPPSRRSVKEYQSILDEIHMIVGEINGNLGKADWTPVKSFHRFLPNLEELIPYYLAADVALVTPLMDGMNLVCKEYISAVEDGVLILSKFAGAAEELKEAIKVNPYDAEEVAQGIEEALCLPKRERSERLNSLKERVKANDLEWWRKEFLRNWLEQDTSIEGSG